MMHNGFAHWVWPWPDHNYAMVVYCVSGRPLLYEDIGKLASPWGMDLLLDAVEGKDGIDIRYHAYDCVDGVRRHRWILGQETDDIDRFLAEGIDENRYAALIYALDKVEVLDAER